MGGRAAADRSEIAVPRWLTSLLRLPEVNLAIFAFLLHFVWEMLQVPLYEGMATMAHWDAVRFCTRATVGDVEISLVAFWVTAILLRPGRRWLDDPWPGPAVLFTALGVAATFVIELLSTEVWHRWAYSELMPVVLGVGVSPLMQWMVLSPLVVWFARRQQVGARRLSENDGEGRKR